MKKFIIKSILFVTILFSVQLGISVYLPPSSRVINSLIFSKIEKDQLLQTVEYPRIIMIGGSNLSFGINSQLLKDELGLNPINTSIQSTIGLEYMLKSTLPFIQKEDIVVISPEYEQFFGNHGHGGEPLFRTIMDISPGDIWKLSFMQWVNIVEYFPDFIYSKLKSGEYKDELSFEDLIYGVNSFNLYGDAVSHWEMDRIDFSIIDNFKGDFNHTMIIELLKFEIAIEEIGAKMCLTFPGFQHNSFENTEDKIHEVAQELESAGFCILGTPERYRIPNKFMFNTPYHLIKEGVEYRTNLLIEDIRNSFLIDDIP